MNSQKPKLHGISRKEPVKKRQLAANPKLKTIGFDKLLDDLRFIEATFAILDRSLGNKEQSPERLQLNFTLIKECLLKAFKEKDASLLLPAEAEIRGYFQDQGDISRKVRDFIVNATASMIKTHIANKNNDSKKLDRASPILLIEELNRKKGYDVNLDGEGKAAYFRLAFLFITISLLLETEPKIALANLPKIWRE